MVSQAGTGGVRPFLQLLEVQALRGAADRELLRRVAAADEAAFRVVAERHGPMVFGVCARLLGNRHDAEDALQATFLVLARRAAAVRTSESLASWLHGVARRVALRLRRADRRRTAREHAAATPDAHVPADALAWAEVRAGLDEELARLPAAYRDVLVSCYLEGLSRDEAAQRLGLDPGAVKGRLERGRRLLGERLVRRGIGLSAGLAAMAVAPEATAALRLGRLATNPTAASPRAAALSHEFLKGVAMSKFKLLTAGVLALAVGVGVGTAQPPTPEKEPVRRAAEVPLGKFGAAPDKDTDEAFIRRLSRDLRGTDPTPAEVHFFLASKDANKRSTLVDLFVKERTAKDAGRADKLGERVNNLVLQAEQVEAVRRYTEAVRLAQAREQEARAQAEKAVVERDAQARQAAEEARARALQVERATLDALEAQRREELRRYEAERAKAERTEAEKAKEKAKGPNTAVPERVPPRPTEKGFRTADPTQKGFREVDDTAIPQLKKAPPVSVPQPGANPAIPAPAANIEVLRVRLKLAEVTVREKVLAVRELEAMVKTGAVPAGQLDRAKLEVERAELQLLEARLTLEQAERTAPRLVPPATRP